MHKRNERVSQIMTIIAEILEDILAVLVGILIVIYLTKVIPEVLGFVHEPEKDYFHVLESILSVAVGVEFLKLLCKPSTVHVIDTIMFLIARHLVVENQSPKEMLWMVLALVLLVLCEVLIAVSKNKIRLSWNQEKRDHVKDAVSLHQTLKQNGISRDSLEARMMENDSFFDEDMDCPDDLD